jgi:hypothetical protein
MLAALNFFLLLAAARETLAFLHSLPACIEVPLLSRRNLSLCLRHTAQAH